MPSDPEKHAMRTRVVQDDPYTPSTRPEEAPGAAPPRAVRSRRWTRGRGLVAVAILATVLGAAYAASRPGGSGADAGPTDDREFAAVDRFVLSELGAQRIPGLALAVVRDGRIVHLRGFGKADSSGRAVTGQTPFIIGSLSKSVTALAVTQLVEEGAVELDAPVQRYIPWFRVADEDASARITVRQLLNHTSGLSTKTGRSFQGRGDTGAGALEETVRDLADADLTAPVGSTYQYSTVNYAVLGLVVQEVSGQAYERYVEDHVFGPLEMRHSFTSKADAEADGLAVGHHYWFGRPAETDLPYNRGLLPAGYLISSAEDLAHYAIAQLDDGRYGAATVVSPESAAELQRPAVPTPKTETSYAMGWFVGPVNGLPAVYHQGETFDYHANIVLLPGSDTGVVVLMNAENSVDLFVRGRMGSVADGVASLLEGRDPPAPPSAVGVFAVYAVLFGALALQLVLIVLGARALRRREAPAGRLGWKARAALALVANLAWALLVLVLVPKQLGLSLLILAQGLPDVAYLLLASGLVALAWGVVRTVWAYTAFHTRGGPARDRGLRAQAKPVA